MRSRVFLLGWFMAGVVSAWATDRVPAAAIPCSCTLLKDTRAVFVGSRTEETPRYRFHVDEKIKGVTSDYFFATQECGPTSELKYAQAVLRKCEQKKTANETLRSMECCCVHRT